MPATSNISQVPGYRKHAMNVKVLMQDALFGLEMRGRENEQSLVSLRLTIQRQTRRQLIISQVNPSVGYKGKRGIPWKYKEEREERTERSGVRESG